MAESGPDLTSSLEVVGRDVVLRIRNDSDRTVEVLNPDLGRPAPEMQWPYSDQTYRVSQLMSFGYLRVSVVDEDGDELEREPVETFATPALRSPVELAPSETLDLLLPLRDFFELSAGHRYRVSVTYGSDVKVHGSATLVSSR